MGQSADGLEEFEAPAWRRTVAHALQVFEGMPLPLSLTTAPALAADVEANSAKCNSVKPRARSSAFVGGHAGCSGDTRILC
jgi:hypothetical protein